MSRARSVLLAGLCLSGICLSMQAALAAAIPIRGRVLDAGGAPLARIKVRLIPLVSLHETGRLELAGKDGPEAVASTESGTDGSFRLEAPETGMWTVVAGDGANQLIPLMTSAAPLLDELDLPAVRLGRESPPPDRIAAIEAWYPLPQKEPLVAPAGLMVPLRVLGADGKPVAGVLVQGENGRALGMTGPEGLVEVAFSGASPLNVALIGADGRWLVTRIEPPRTGETRQPRELRLPDAASVTVRVVSAADGRPIPGSLVWTSFDLGAFRRADARGEARLPIPKEWTVDGSASARGFLPAMVDLSAAVKKPERTVTVSLQPDLALTGIVVTENGTPLPGAEIGMSAVGARMSFRSRIDGEPDVLTRSGPDGRFRLSGLEPNVPIELRVVKEGFAPSRMEAVSPSPSSPGERPAALLRIVLRRGASAFGLVEGVDRQPIQGAQVTLRAGGSSDPEEELRSLLEPGSRETFEAVTGEEGRFDFSHLPAGRYDLTAKGRGWAPLTVPGLEIPEGNLATDLGTLALARGAVLEGEVVDAAGKPVEGAEIRLEEAGGPMVPAIPRFFLGERSEPDALSGPDGFFRIEDLRAGRPVALSIQRPGYAPGLVEDVPVPAEPPFRITLQGVGSLSGRVVDPDGRPIAGANLNVQAQGSGRGGFRVFHQGMTQFGSSDSEGRFRIADVTPGLVILSAAASGWQNSSVEDLELRGGEEKSGIEITLSPAALLEGKVLSSSGRPVEGADVRSSLEGRPGELQATQTNAEGHYVLDGLMPGLYAIEAAHPEHGTGRRQIELRLGKSSLDIALEGGREVSGRVVDDTGAPAAGAYVRLISDRIWGSPNTQSRGDGSFRFPSIEEGSYQVSARKEGFAGSESVPIQVEGSSVTGLEIRLSRGGSIVGRITGVEIADLARLQIMAQGRGMPAGGQIQVDGSYRIDHLAAGAWKVRAELPGTGLAAEGSVRLEPGASEARLDLELEKGLELSGRVRKGGAPAPGMTLFLEGPRQVFSETNTEGRFRFQGLGAGTYNLQVGDSRSTSRHQETIELQADRDITIDLPTGEVTGRVIDAADSSPLSGVSVQLLSAAGSAPIMAETDNRGAFALHGVAEGSWRLRAQADGYAPGEAAVQVDGTGAPDVELTLRATEGVTLLVTSAGGPPPRQLFYAVLDGAGGQVADGLAVVDENGRARLARVPPGGWQVMLLSQSTAPLEVSVTAPGDAGRAVLLPQCTLRVRVPALEDAPATVLLLGPDGRPFRAFGRFGALTTAFEMSRGIRVWGDVPPGTWDVRVTAKDGRTWNATATTAPGAPAEVVLE